MPGLKALLGKGKGLTVRYHFMPSRVAIIKKTITNVSKDMEKLGPSYTAGGAIK